MPRVVHHWWQNETKSQTLRAKTIMPKNEVGFRKWTRISVIS